MRAGTAVIAIFTSKIDCVGWFARIDQAGRCRYGPRRPADLRRGGA